ncbi:MAG: isomerizing glutamine--fructose-6-phosphate transaminase, partial [Rhodospirillaceae bacterium]|nr:isomerizing glutamine--fructose-6-phosphate transaminase [Rhodospirillaceae bacterium]
MCGIIGIVGGEPCIPLLVDGLKRLEYRGYDSAGVATVENGVIRRRRAEGKIGRLEAKLRDRPIGGTIGIGHTRWATHGIPNEINAHPHITDKVALVHNGIIENYRELKDELRSRGRSFESDTDTEVVAELLTEFMERQMPLRDAVRATLQRLHGAFALAIVFAGEEELMVGARRGSPLAIGYGDGEMFLGSDALALAPLTRRIGYLEEGDWVVMTRKGATVYDAAGEPAERRIVETAASGAQTGKAGFRHYMLKEIYEQPTAIGDTLQSFFNPAWQTVNLPDLPFDIATVPRITVAACGTAFYAGLVA